MVNQLRQMGAFEEISGLLLGTFTEAEAALGVTAPVSYTHLDVYKRQVWICAAFGAGFAAILICWQFIYTICAQVGYTKEDKWPKMMICAIIFFNALGALALPFQGGVVANFGFLAKASNSTYVSYNYVQYLGLSVVFCAVTMVLYLSLIHI